MKLRAFTLTELLIALAVLGLLIAILTPIISNLLPEQNALMAKRSYYAAQTLVSDMLNDEACYPDNSQSIYKDASGNYLYRRIGFDDGFGYADCIKWGGVEHTESVSDACENSSSKFIIFFKNKLDIKNNNDENEENDANGVFETRDGMRWAIEPGFVANNKDSYAKISVDVNGGENPNCGQSGEASSDLQTGSDCASRNDDYDIYTMRVYADGRMEIRDQWAIDAVDINKDVTSSD